MSDNNLINKNYNGFVKRKSNKIIIIYIIFIVLFASLFCYYQIFNRKLNKIIYLDILSNENIISFKNEFMKKMIKLENLIKNKDNFNISKSGNKTFDEIINNQYREMQVHFCKSNNLFTDINIESNIKIANVSFDNMEFKMFVYKNKDAVSNDIYNTGSWEGNSTKKLLACLDYYSKMKKLPKNEILVVDIGANIGWYSFYLGKVGYEILSFEASQINNYILKKNFCLNKDVKITLINKAIGLEDKKCILHHPSQNVGNAVLLCEENINIIPKNNYLTEEIKFTKLSNYIPFLSKKNLALIKLDIEGSEGKAIYSGIELITKYHIPFIFIEFAPSYLKMQGTDPKIFLETFEKNGYKISRIDFLSKIYSPIDELIKMSLVNLYIIYLDFIK